MLSSFSKNRNTLSFVVLMISIFVFGSILHYFRGYYLNESIYPHTWGIDDAFISYRYGWNLVHFGNLSWNESGFRKVEGFTNPLWVLLSALWSLPGNKDWVYPGVAISSVAFSAYLLWMAQKLLLQKYGKSVALTGLLILCLTPFMWADATSGLESVVFGLLLALLAYLANHIESLNLSQKYQIVAFSFLACLLRSDGAIYVAVIFAGLFISRNPTAKLVLFGLLSGSLLLNLFRYFYFGTFLPNTAIAKLNFGLMDRLPVGLEILFVILVYGGGVFLFMGTLGIRSTEKRNVQLADICILLGWSAYFVYIGGDTFRERHLIAPFAYGAMISSAYWSRKDLTAAIKITGVMLILIWLPLFFFDARFSYLQSKPDDPLIALGKTIALDRQKYGTIAIGPAGKPPFFAGGDFVDAWGLNDSYLATIKRPRFVPGHSSGSEIDAIEIARENSPSNYSLLTFTPTPFLRSPEDVYLWVYASRPDDGVHSRLSAAELQSPLMSEIMYMSLLIHNP